MSTQSHDPYKAAGVDTAKGDALAEWLSDSEARSFVHPHGFGSLTSGIGGFAGMFDLNIPNMRRPQLVASTDGVGTKLLLGLNSNQLEHLGQDLVAMCVNDLYTVGATPLFFLDYYATGVLNEEAFKLVLTSIKDSCRQCGMALMGGETAEMPGLYEKGHFDLAGFVVGVVDYDNRLTAERTKVGDVLVAWQSSGFHSNGYSLIRKWLEDFPSLATAETLKNLMIPTRLYPQVVKLLEQFKQDYHAAANITGGGISGNLPRVIADGIDCEISISQLPILPWMKDFIEASGSTIQQVEGVFNLGCGMISVIAPQRAPEFVKASEKAGLLPRIVGKLVPGKGGSSQVHYTT